LMYFGSGLARYPPSPAQGMRFESEWIILVFQI